MEALFFTFLFLAIYPYLVYPLLLPVIASLFGRPVRRCEWTPTVSMIIPVYNEKAVLAQKLENTLALDYPPEHLEILVGSDGSTDGSAEIMEEYAGKGIRTFHFPERRGKPTILNDLVAASEGEILIMTDASALLHRGAVRAITSSFAGDDIGVVSGEMIPEHGQGAASAMDLYRRIDNRIRRLESHLHSSSGAAGALYGIRRTLFQPLPPGTILDDFVIPLRAVEKGYRLLICPQASFEEIEQTSPKAEFRRKVRTLAGNYQALGWLWRLLIPVRSPVWFFLLSHKLMRLFTPYFMLVLWPLSFGLRDHPLFLVAFLAQTAFYASGVLGFLLRHHPRRIALVHYPFLFVLMQAANLCSLFLFLSGQISTKWTRETT